MTIKWLNTKWLNAKSLVAFALTACIATPLILSSFQGPDGVNIHEADRRINIITPHNETIRREFGEAFQSWWQAKTGESVYVNWLTPGGTSEIRMVLDSRFTSAKKNGDRGIGIDVFFGGGDYIFGKQAKKGRLAKLDVFEKHPEWFKPEVIPRQFTGETYYDENHQWVGVCLSRFGICYNEDALRRRGLKPPTQWSDLADPKYFGGIALADPTKSGSVARAFEMLIQQQIHETMANSKRQPGKTPWQFKMRVCSEGWDKGLNLIQKISANARYFTDSSTKIPRDVAQGDAVAGMCVDYYGRTYEEMLTHADGSSRLHWIFPEGGTSMSTDPVAVFRGAPDPVIAQAFVEFLLTEKGQKLWNAKPGTPDGPKHRALRRMPIRRDVYTPENMQYFTDPSNPYQHTGGFVYQRELTGQGFAALRFIIRVMCLDSHHELKSAWKKISDAGMPPQALKIFEETTVVSYQNAMGGISKQLSHGRKIHSADMAVRLGKFFRKNYKRAEKRVKKETPHPHAHHE
jgi:ABC-type Fe3+ transport system substrate-binding protein